MSPIEIFPIEKAKPPASQAVADSLTIDDLADRGTNNATLNVYARLNPTNSERIISGAAETGYTVIE